jgi:ABC-2 type transport system permease protein
VSAAFPALLFLLLRTARNRAVRLVSRVRSPRYALAMLAGLAYVILIARNSGNGGATEASIPDVLRVVLLALGVLAIVVWAWVYSHDARPLAFTTAEVTFLFPAPVSRRTLIRFKLARAQLLVLLNTLIWAVVIDVGRSGMPTWMRVVSIWCVLSTLHLHRLGAAFTRASLGEHARTGRRVLVISLLAAAATLIGAALIAAAPVLASARGFEGLGQAVAEASRLPFPALVLAPFVTLVRPLAVPTGSWLGAMVPALGILLLHYLWVVRSDAAFEEAAAEASFVRARELEARRAGVYMSSSRETYSPPLTRLAAMGRPQGAIFWKNITMVLRRRRARMLLIAYGVLLVAAAAATDVAPRIAHAIGMVILTWGGLMAVLGPQWVRNDLRSDLARLDLLRGYPVEPDALVRAEAGAAALIVTLAQLVLLTIAAVALWDSPEAQIGMPGRAIVLVSALLLLPCLNFMGLMIMNGAALLFPAWVNPSRSRAGGVDTLGQNVLTAAAYVLVLAVALLVPALVGAAIGYLLRPVLGPWSAAAAAGVAAAVLALQAWLLSVWLGMAFERIDPPTSGIEAA